MRLNYHTTKQCLIMHDHMLQPRVKKYTNFPVPIEMLAVVLGTAVSYFAGLETYYDIKVVGDIPTG